MITEKVERTMNSIRIISSIVVIVLTITCNGFFMGQRIIQGDNAQIKQYPYQVYILRLQQDVQCGGALISSNVVLTAGHCYIPGEETIVRAGSTNKFQGGQIRRVIYGIIHFKYSGEPHFHNDIAVLFVDRSFYLSHNVQTVQLPAGENDNPRLGDVGVTTGWGYTRSNGNAIYTLRQVRIPVMDRKTCQKQQNKFLKLQITEKKLCAGYLNNAKGICQGDSGGPYVINGVLHGITSHNSALENCGKVGVPSVFTRVSAYRTWIHKAAKI